MEQEKAIVLNRMYVGDYLQQGNLGHEIINLYKSDKNDKNPGSHYLYLQEDGKFNKSFLGKIDCMLLVTYIGNNQLEVLAKAEGLIEVYRGNISQKGYIDNNRISYGGALLGDIFRGNNFVPKSQLNNETKEKQVEDKEDNQDVYITYKADRVLRPKDYTKKQIIIQFGEQELTNEPSDTVIILKGYNMAKTSLKQYISGEILSDEKIQKQIDNKIKQRTKPTTEDERATMFEAAKVQEQHKPLDYANLRKLINNEDLWEKESSISTFAESKNKYEAFPQTMFDICEIKDCELAYSNALAFFLRKYPEFANEFVCKITDGKVKKLSSNYKVIRESKFNIDIYIEDDNNVFVIENKVKSDIGIYEKQTKENPYPNQLEKYFGEVEKETGNKKMKYYFVLIPNYSKIEAKRYCNSFETIKYSTLYELMKNNSLYKGDENNPLGDIHFKEFTNALKRHTENYNNELFIDMQVLFEKRISKAFLKGYSIKKFDNGSIEVRYNNEIFNNTKEALRNISGQIGFKYEGTWNTQFFGKQLIEFLDKKNK